jgi:galactonate dehydratase
VKGAVEHYPEVVDWYFSIPGRPGLGITLNEDFVAAHPREHIHFKLFTDGWQKRQAKI